MAATKVDQAPYQEALQEGEDQDQPAQGQDRGHTEDRTLRKDDHIRDLLRPEATENTRAKAEDRMRSLSHPEEKTNPQAVTHTKKVIDQEILEKIIKIKRSHLTMPKLRLQI